MSCLTAGIRSAKYAVRHIRHCANIRGNQMVHRMPCGDSWLQTAGGLQKQIWELQLYIIILWNHHGICGPLMIEGLCGTYLNLIII